MGVRKPETINSEPARPWNWMGQKFVTQKFDETALKLHDSLFMHLCNMPNNHMPCWFLKFFGKTSFKNILSLVINLHWTTMNLTDWRHCHQKAQTDIHNTSITHAYLLFGTNSCTNHVC